MQYQILTSEQPNDLMQKVNAALASGWDLHGGTCASAVGTNLLLCQAVTLTPKVDKADDHADTVGQTIRRESDLDTRFAQ